MFYAYIHARPDGTPFYVGKGIRERAVELTSNRNKYHNNIVAKHGAENILVGKMDCSSEEIAFELEKGLIKCLRRAGVKLANMTDGGEGCSGLIYSEQSRAKMSASQKLRIRTPEEIARMSASLKGRIFSEEHKEALRGRKLSREHRDKLSALAKNRNWKPTEETLLKAAEAKQTPEFRKQQSKRMKEYYSLHPSGKLGCKLSDESKLKISVARKGQPHHHQGKLKDKNLLLCKLMSEGFTNQQILEKTQRTFEDIYTMRRYLRQNPEPILTNED